MAGSLPATWAVHENTPFHLTDFAHALGTATMPGLAVGDGAAHADSRKAKRSNGNPAFRATFTLHLRSACPRTRCATTGCGRTSPPIPVFGFVCCVRSCADLSG